MGGRAALAVSRVVGGAGEARLASEEAKESRLRAPHNRYRDGVPPPGIFWLFAIGELVGDKHCAIRTSIFALQW